MTNEDLINFCESKNYDLRISHNARWIDQKCTPDVLWSISDFVLNYVENVKETFTPSDIWHSDYAKQTIAETYSKPGTDETAAENEYDKVFSQPLCLLTYAGVLKDISTNKHHLYQIENKEVLEYIATNDIFSLRFLQAYIEKVLKDSDLFGYFYEFFQKQTKEDFDRLKTAFINFYHTYTPVLGDYEPKRIFTKVINPLAHKYGKCGSKRGRMSQFKITKAEMMYNQDNFRDIYKGKPKNVTRKDWLSSHPADIRVGYFTQMLNNAKKLIRNNIITYRNSVSELTQFNSAHSDATFPSQIHHIFPKNEFPEIMHYLENLVALTPNQHYGFAHPNNNTQIIDLDAQKVLLIAKTYSVKMNLENIDEKTIYSFENLLYVLHIGWSDDDVLTIDNDDYCEVLRCISSHYASL